MKFLLFIILLGIVFSLGSALVQMLSDKGDSEKMMKSLAIRVGLSFFFVLLLFVLFQMGLIEPNIAPN